MIEIKIKIKFRSYLNSLYTHIGGLYVLKTDNDYDDLNKDKNINYKLYHCKDFYDENTGHKICKNNDILYMIKDINMIYHNYLALHGDQSNMLSNCQKNKNLQIIIPFKKNKKDTFKDSTCKNNYFTYRNLLEIDNKIRLIKDINDIQSNKEFYFEKNVSDIWFQYIISGHLQKNDFKPKKFIIFWNLMLFSRY